MKKSVTPRKENKKGYMCRKCGVRHLPGTKIYTQHRPPKRKEKRSHIPGIGFVGIGNLERKEKKEVYNSIPIKEFWN